MYSIVGAFAGIVSIAGLAFCVNRGGGRRKPWKLGVDLKDSYDSQSTSKYNCGLANSYLHDETKKSHSVDRVIKSSGSSCSDALSHCQSIIDNIHSLEAQDSEDRDGDEYRIPMQVEDRLELVQVPSLKSSSSSASSISGRSFEDIDMQSSKSKEYGAGDLEMIAEVDLEEESISCVDADDDGYGADVDVLHRPTPEAAERLRRPTNPTRFEILQSVSSADSSLSGRPPLYINPNLQRVESIGRMTMLSTPQSVDSEGSVELILPHDGSI